MSEVVALKAIDLFVVYKSLFASVNLLFSTISLADSLFIKFSLFHIASSLMNVNQIVVSEIHSSVSH